MFFRIKFRAEDFHGSILPRNAPTVPHRGVRVELREEETSHWSPLPSSPFIVVLSGMRELGELLILHHQLVEVLLGLCATDKNRFQQQPVSCDELWTGLESKAFS